ncbi:hypothetical protein AVEN_248207-1 [Araneus ventricosus]|uniref:Uncharacterized protein n=1 Tax=Araneus ventricosus TaxID=182803 RepID=A0A4Y2J8F4_ARAVE|nr:hypothetical protein AVEN_248207-1 [Araneus ventricosus]
MPSDPISPIPGDECVLLCVSLIVWGLALSSQNKTPSRELPHRWIGRAGLDDAPLLSWPPRSPDLTPCDFFLWGYVNDKVYVPTMPITLQALQERITAAVTDIDGNMLLNVWSELDYRWDVRLVTKGAHIEHL